MNKMIDIFMHLSPVVQGAAVLGLALILACSLKYIWGVFVLAVVAAFYGLLGIGVALLYVTLWAFEKCESAWYRKFGYPGRPKAKK
jgi:hypothetical protein